MLKKSSFIGVFIFVFLLVLFLYWFLNNKTNENKVLKNNFSDKSVSLSSTNILITLNPTQKKEIVEQASAEADYNRVFDIYKSKTPLLRLMPVMQPDFKIEYKGNTLYKITILNRNKEEGKKKVLDWWRKNNVNPDDLNIQWE